MAETHSSSSSSIPSSPTLSIHSRFFLFWINFHVFIIFFSCAFICIALFIWIFQKGPAWNYLATFCLRDHLLKFVDGFNIPAYRRKQEWVPVWRALHITTVRTSIKGITWNKSMHDCDGHHMKQSIHDCEGHYIKFGDVRVWRASYETRVCTTVKGIT